MCGPLTTMLPAGRHARFALYGLVMFMPNVELWIIEACCLINYDLSDEITRVYRISWSCGVSENISSPAIPQSITLVRQLDPVLGAPRPFDGTGNQNGRGNWESNYTSKLHGLC